LNRYDSFEHGSTKLELDVGVYMHAQLNQVLEHLVECLS
jgi:hypothetical protein